MDPTDGHFELCLKLFYLSPCKLECFYGLVTVSSLPVYLVLDAVHCGTLRASSMRILCKRNRKKQIRNALHASL